MLEGVGIGDLHFDKLNKLFPKADDLIVAEVRKALDYAVDRDVHNVFFYGDVGDTARMSYEANLAFWDLLFQDDYRGLRFDVILGNHDFDEHGRHSLELLSWVHRHFGGERKLRVHTQPSVITMGGVPVQFLPYPYVKTRADCLNVGHFESSGSIRDNGMRISKGVSTKHLSLVGHLHTPHSVNRHYFSGTLYQTNFGESLPKKFHHFKVASDLTHKIKMVPNDPDFKLINLEIWGTKDLKKISPNPLHLYKVYVQEGVIMDETSFAPYPNVVKIIFFKTKGELKTLLEEEWRSAESVTSLYQPKADLKAFLTKRQVEAPLRRRVLELHKQIFESNLRKPDNG